MRIKKCLDYFLPKFTNYLNENFGKNNYNIIIVEEKTPETNTFNLGKTINIGFDIVKNKMKDF